MISVAPVLCSLFLGLHGWCITEIVKSKYTHLNRSDERRIVATVKADTKEKLDGIEKELAKIAARLDVLAETQVRILIAVEASKKMD